MKTSSEEHQSGETPWSPWQRIPLQRQLSKRRSLLLRSWACKNSQQLSPPALTQSPHLQPKHKLHRVREERGGREVARRIIMQLARELQLQILQTLTQLLTQTSREQFKIMGPLIRILSPNFWRQSTVPRRRLQALLLLQWQPRRLLHATRTRRTSPRTRRTTTSSLPARVFVLQDDFSMS